MVGTSGLTSTISRSFSQTESNGFSTGTSTRSIAGTTYSTGTTSYYTAITSATWGYSSVTVAASSYSSSISLSTAAYSTFTHTTSSGSSQATAVATGATIRSGWSSTVSSNGTNGLTTNAGTTTFSSTGSYSGMTLGTTGSDNIETQSLTYTTGGTNSFTYNAFISRRVTETGYPTAAVTASAFGNSYATVSAPSVKDIFTTGTDGTGWALTNTTAESLHRHTTTATQTWPGDSTATTSTTREVAFPWLVESLANTTFIFNEHSSLGGCNPVIVPTASGSGHLSSLASVITNSTVGSGGTYQVSTASAVFAPLDFSESSSSFTLSWTTPIQPAITFHTLETGTVYRRQTQRPVSTVSGGETTATYEGFDTAWNWTTITETLGTGENTFTAYGSVSASIAETLTSTVSTTTGGHALSFNTGAHSIVAISTTATSALTYTAPATRSVEEATTGTTETTSTGSTTTGASYRKGSTAGTANSVSAERIGTTTANSQSWLSVSTSAAPTITAFYSTGNRGFREFGTGTEVSTRTGIFQLATHSVLQTAGGNAAWITTNEASWNFRLPHSFQIAGAGVTAYPRHVCGVTISTVRTSSATPTSTVTTTFGASTITETRGTTAGGARSTTTTTAQIYAYPGSTTSVTISGLGTTSTTGRYWEMITGDSTKVTTTGGTWTLTGGKIIYSGGSTTTTGFTTNGTLASIRASRVSGSLWSLADIEIRLSHSAIATEGTSTTLADSSGFLLSGTVAGVGQFEAWTNPSTSNSASWQTIRDGNTTVTSPEFWRSAPWGNVSSGNSPTIWQFLGIPYDRSGGFY
jgi:hypothetical protein